MGINFLVRNTILCLLQFFIYLPSLNVIATLYGPRTAGLIGMLWGVVSFGISIFLGFGIGFGCILDQGSGSGLRLGSDWDLGSALGSDLDWGSW